jgi:hypothetical protein
MLTSSKNLKIIFKRFKNDFLTKVEDFILEGKTNEAVI